MLERGGDEGGEMVRYPVVLEPDDNGTVMVTFLDFPEAQTFGENEADALARASDALATIVDGYIRARRPLPGPSHSSGPAAELSPLMSTKVELYNAMQALGVTKSALRQRLNWHAPQVDRLLNLTHSSQVDQLDAAARALGGTLTMHIEGLPQRPRAVYGGNRRELSVAAAVSSGRQHRTESTRSAGSSGERRKSVARKK
jgi:antitoxin HicB